MRSNKLMKSARIGILMGASLSALALSAPAAAQDQPTGELAADEDKVDELVVIGTRRTDRSVLDSASPVDVIGATELRSAPQANLLDTIRTVVPSFFVPQNTISDASTFVRAPSLRGQGADQILVMVNGKRYNRAALVNVFVGADTALSFGAQGADISNIPAIALKNLQVLRDGATAQYGSDAIAGVINHQLRDDDGIELTGIIGQNYRGDGDLIQISGNAGVKLGDRGFINLSAEYFDSGLTSRGETRPAAVLLAQSSPSLAPRIPFADRGLPAQIWGSSPSDGYRLFLNSAFDISSDVQLYLAVNVASSETDQSFNYRPPVTFTNVAAFDGTSNVTRNLNRNGSFNPIFLTPCPANNPTCPAGGFVNNTNQFTFASIYPAGFTPLFTGKVDQAWGNGGIRGSAESGFTYDLSATFARNSLDLSMTNSLSASFGPQSQTSFSFGKLIQSETNLNADFTYPVEVGFASPITLSGGLEYRREQYEKTVGDLQSYAAGPFARQPLFNQVSPGVFTPALNASGAQIIATQSPAASGYGGTSPAFAGVSSQENYGIYIGAETDITDSLTVGAAGRYEEYTTFGSAVVGKLNFLYRITDAISVRGTVGTGFHAPSPGQNNTQIVTTNFVAGEQVQTGTYPVTSTIAQFYGATTLDPERSTNFGLGIVLNPTDSFSLTIDGYSIRVRDRIGISQNFTVTAADLAALPALATVGVGGVVNYFTNGFDTTTDGVDVVANWRTEAANNPLSLTFAYNYNLNRVTDFNPLVINAARRDVIRNLAPKHRIVASANYQIGDFSVNARANYFGSWSNELDYPGQSFGAKTIFDLDASYTFAERFTLTVGANNLFNTFPDRIAATPLTPIFPLTNSLADGQVYPRSGGPFGMNGGFYYARVRVDF